MVDVGIWQNLKWTKLNFYEVITKYQVKNYHAVFWLRYVRKTYSPVEAFCRLVFITAIPMRHAPCRKARNPRNKPVVALSENIHSANSVIIAKQIIRTKAQFKFTTTSENVFDLFMKIKASPSNAMMNATFLVHIGSRLYLATMMSNTPDNANKRFTTRHSNFVT